MDKCFEVAAEGRLQDLKSLIAENSALLKAVDERGKTLLHVAAECGQGEVVQYLNDVGSLSIDVKDNAGNTPLHLGVLNNHVGITDLLLSLGASAVAPNGRKVLPMHLALRNKCSIEMIATFAKYHDITDQVSRGFRDYTSLHVVAANDNLKALEILCETAVGRPQTEEATIFLQLNSVDKDGLTPIHLAARKGSCKVLDFMISKAIEHGLEPQKIFESMSEKDSTPLHFAVEGNSLEIIQVLLKHGASPTATRGKQEPPIHLACSQNKLNVVRVMVEQCGQDILNCKNKRGQTPLHHCTNLIGGKQLISYLLNQGSQLNIRDSHGHTPLQIAVQLGNAASMEQFLAGGASPLIKDNRGCNCLHVAVKFKRREVFKQLLQHPSISEMSNMTNNDGNLPIHLALREGLSDFVTPLLKCTAHPSTDKNDNNYFHLAAVAGDEKSIEILLTYPFAESMLNATNSDGKTPLHCSAISGNIACITLLLDHGAVVNKCHIGRTPFMYACSKGKLQSAKVLYEAHPMQRDWKDDEGNTALHLSAHSGSADVTIYCLDIGMKITLNDKKKTFLDIVIAAVNAKLAIAVLKHERWEACLDVCCPTKLHPVIRMINRIPSAYQVILDRSVTRSPLDSQHKDYWEKYNFKYVSLHDRPTDDADTTAVHVDLEQKVSPLDSQHKNYWKKYNFKYVCLQDRPTDEADTTTVHVDLEQEAGTDLTVSDNSEKKAEAVHVPVSEETKSIVHRSDASKGTEVQLQMESFHKDGKLSETSKDANIHLETVHGIQRSAKSDISHVVKKEHEKSISEPPAQAIDGDVTNRQQQSRRHGNVPTMAVLNHLAEKKVKSCLTHPVIVKYLYLKWADYAHMLYIITFLLILLMTIFLSTFIGISPVPSQGGESMEAIASSDMNETTAESVTQDQISTAANVIRFVTIFFAVLNALNWILTIYVMRVKLLTHFMEEFEFWGYGCAILATLIYLIPFRGLNSVIYEAGAIAVFTSWCVALVQIELLGAAGIYVSMLISTTKNVLKVLLICFFLLCAFAFSFYILVGSFSQLQFTNVGTSLVSSLSSVLAIIDLNTFVALEFDGLLRFRVLTFILYVIMVIILPIVLINLLIGLAVGDIAKIQEEAEIDRQVLVITYLSKIDERLLPRSALVKFCRTSYTLYPNKTGGSLFTRFKRFLAKSQLFMTYGILTEEINQEAGEEDENIGEAVVNLQQQVEELVRTQAKQSETLARMELMLQKMMDHKGLKYD